MVKKSFWLEDAQAKDITTTAKALKITESAVVRALLIKKATEARKNKNV